MTVDRDLITRLQVADASAPRLVGGPITVEMLAAAHGRRQLRRLAVCALLLIAATGSAFAAWSAHAAEARADVAHRVERVRHAADSLLALLRADNARRATEARVNDRAARAAERAASTSLWYGQSLLAERRPRARRHFESIADLLGDTRAGRIARARIDTDPLLQPERTGK